MNRIENVIYTTNGLSTETHKSFPIHYGLRREKIQCVFSHVCIAINGIKLIYGIQIHKKMIFIKIKSDKCYKDVVYRLSQKFSDLNWGNV